MSENSEFAFVPSCNDQSCTQANISKINGDIYDLADAFLSIASMTHKKLQKLCFYAKAWYLAIYDNNIVDEEFEAWVHGAVQPGLYQKYRVYGFGYIPQVRDTSGIPEEFLSFIMIISKKVYHFISKYTNINSEYFLINLRKLLLIK